MSESFPLAIIGTSCLFPKAEDLRTYWATSRTAWMRFSPIPEAHTGRSRIISALTRARTDRTYARRGGFLSPVDFVPMDFGIAPKIWRPPIQRSSWECWLPNRPWRMRVMRTNRSHVTARVSLGVTGALELIAPLGARLGHPIWRRALQEAGVGESVAEDVVQRIRTLTWAGRRIPFPACWGMSRPVGSPTGWTSGAPIASSMPLAPARWRHCTWRVSN